MHAYGRGVPRNETEAFAWVSLAALSNKDVAEIRDVLEKSLTSEVKAHAKQRSMELQKEIEAKIAAKKAGK
jgi:TPR repeat protein